MITLEIQCLSERRENLLIEVGRAVVASGFILQRQRLAEDHHGILLTLVVRGPANQQRTLSAALDANDRLISFVISAFAENDRKPHFAASIKRTPKMATPAVVATTVARAINTAAAVDASADQFVLRAEPAPALAPDREIWMQADFLAASAFVPAKAPAPYPARAPIERFVEPSLLEPSLLAPSLLESGLLEAGLLEAALPETARLEATLLGPDESAVDTALSTLAREYPDIFPGLLALQHAVTADARAASLLQAGRRLGTWLFERDHAARSGLTLQQAIERVGSPALRALVDVDQRGEQLHIRHSPLCLEDGPSSCQFFSGYLESLLRPVMASDAVSIFSLGCRSCGAGECILALSDGEA